MDTEKENEILRAGNTRDREAGTSGVERASMGKGMTNAVATMLNAGATVGEVKAALGDGALVFINPGVLNAAAIDAGLGVGSKLTGRMPCPCGSGKIYKNCCRKREGRRVNVPPITFDPTKAKPRHNPGMRWGEASQAEQDTWLGQMFQYVERALPPGPSNNGHALFVLVMFDPDKPGQCAHVSNADLRQNVPEAFRQLAVCFETGSPVMMPSPDSVESMALQALATLSDACVARDAAIADDVIDDTAIREAYNDAINFAEGVIAYAKNPKGSPVPQIAVADEEIRDADDAYGPHAYEPLPIESADPCKCVACGLPEHDPIHDPANWRDEGEAVPAHELPGDVRDTPGVIAEGVAAVDYAGHVVDEPVAPDVTFCVEGEGDVPTVRGAAKASGVPLGVAYDIAHGKTPPPGVDPEPFRPHPVEPT